MSTLKIVYVFAIAFLAVAFLMTAQATFAAKSDAVYVEGEMLVKYKNGTVSDTAKSLNRQFGANVLEEFPELGWQRVKLPSDLSTRKALSLYGGNPEVEAVQPNFYYHLLATPNDPRFGDLYGMQKISAPAAWDLWTGSATTVVAVLDTGINYNHEDLAANMWKNTGEVNGNGIDDDGNGFTDDFYGFDFFYNDSDPLDQNGHGTHVAGTIGAVGNNAVGVVGVNWNVKIMAIKIYSPVGTDTTSAMLVNAYNYVRLMKNRGVNIRVTNNSYGGCGEACGYDQATKDALDALGNAGILNVFAAGNDNRNIETAPAFPASYTSPSVLSVASSNSSDARSGFSNFGATSVDLAAPGSGILSTYNSSNSSYATLSGTSMATPHTAGAAALLSSFNQNLSPASLKATLMNTVDVLPQWNGVVKTGGRLNINSALRNQTACAFNIASNPLTAPTTGGSLSASVTAPANCDFSAISNSSFITITGGNPGSGNSTVTFTVLPNSGSARTGTINVGGTTLTVNQSGTTAARTVNQALDFDGDGRTDYSVIQNFGGTMIWHNYQTTNGYAPISFGLFAEDVPVANDYDGDRKTDIGVWRSSNGTFYVLESANNTFRAFQFGQTGDNPAVSQDFDGDGKADFAVTRPVGGTLIWYISGSTDGFSSTQYGAAADKPLRGDFDGDRKADLAVYRPETGSPANTFFVQKSSDNTQLAVAFGTSATDKITTSDYDGDRKTDFAVWRTTNGVWYILNSSNGSLTTFPFGANGDLPAPGDYDGDEKADFAVWRPNVDQNKAGIFYIQKSSDGFDAFSWGNLTMKVPANSINSQ